MKKSFVKNFKDRELIINNKIIKKDLDIKIIKNSNKIIQ